MEGVIKESVWRKGLFVCNVEFEKIGNVSLSLSPEQLADMGCGYSQGDIEEAFKICNLWINHCERGCNVAMLRQYDLDVVKFRRAHSVLNELKTKRLKVRFEFV